MKQSDLDFYEEMNEMFQTKGWSRLLEIVEADLKGMEIIYDLDKTEEIFRVQGHRRPLLWLQNYEDSLAQEFKLAIEEEKAEEEFDDNADL